jgi:predicted phosphodiesterase
MLPKLRFIVHAGDLVNRAGRDAEWGEWHAAAGWINRSVVAIPTPGNHEYGSKQLTTHWRPQFTLPENGVKGLEETNYYVDIHGVRMVALNSNRMQKEQAEWLDNLFPTTRTAGPCSPSTTPSIPRPALATTRRLRELWQPILDKHRVDIVLTGHDHTYARSNLRTGLNTQEGTAGTVYVVSVSGPKMYNLDREDPGCSVPPRTRSSARSFALTATPCSTRPAPPVASSTMPSTSTSSQGKPNQLVNKVPQTPELRRQ